MKIKIIKPFAFSQDIDNDIKAGTIFEARLAPGQLFGKKYQIVEGEFAGNLLTELHCIELPEEPKHDNKLVVLPVKVAEAVEKLKLSGWKVEDLLNTIEFMDSSFKPTVEPSHPGYPIAKYLQKHNLSTYASALVNGYTVETLESKIKAGVRAVYREWLESPSHEDEEDDEEELAQLITDLVTQIIREDGAITT